MVTALNRSNFGQIKISTWFLALYMFLTPLDFMPILAGVSILRILAFLPLLGCLFYIKSMKIYFDKYFLLPVIYVAFLALTSLYSFNLYDTQERMISTGTNIALILLLAMLDYNSSEIIILKRTLVMSGWFALIMLLYTGRDHLDYRATVAIGDIAQDHNYLVGYFIFTLIFCLEQLIQKKKLINIVFIAFFIGILFLTGSRGGLMAVFGSMLFFILIWLKDQKSKYFVLIRALLITFLLAYMIYLVFGLLPPEMRDRFTPSIEAILEGGSTRFVIWDNIIDSYNSTPLIYQIFGMGAGTVRNFTDANIVGHSIWLDSLIEIGLFGTLILFVFYFSFFKKAYDLKEYVVASVFTGYMLMAMTMSLYRYRPLWNILLLILILIKNNRITQEEKPT